MGVDAVSGTPPDDGFRVVNGTGNFVLDVQIREAATAWGSWAAKLSWDPNVLEFVPTDDVNGNTVLESWHYTDLGAPVLDAANVYDNVLGNVKGGSLKASGTTTATGVVLNATFHCIGNGDSQLTLVSLDDDPAFGTTTLDASSSAIGTDLTQATVLCQGVSPAPPAGAAEAAGVVNWVVDIWAAVEDAAGQR